MSNTYKISLVFFFLFFSLIEKNTAQNILVNQGVRAGDLWCFPAYEDSLSYYYLPNRGRLLETKDGLPAFSFTQYSIKNTNESGLSTVNEANGGGILHFLFTYDTPKASIAAATKQLRDKLNNDEIQLKRPIIFSSARFNVISSILHANKKELELISSGQAPVMENGQIALSFNLDKVQSQLLVETFKNPTSDISVTFELTFEGLSSPYNATLEVDWEKVHKSERIGGNINVYFVSADIEKSFAELRRSEAIELTQIGEHTPSENLVNIAYSKLMDMLFDEVEPSQIPPENKNSLGDLIGGLVGNTVSSYFSLGVVYKKKKIQQSGQSRLLFNGRSVIERNHYITFNLKDLYKKYGKDKRIFRKVPLWNPEFQQRKVYMGLDGSTQKEMGKMINNVTLSMRKKHKNGEETLGQYLIQINRDTSWTYLNYEDTDLEKWMEYEYQIIWDFVGYQENYTSDWMPSKSAKINLYSPFKRKKIELVGDIDNLKDQGIRKVQVKIEYPFYGKKEEESLLVNSNRGLEEQFFEVTLPEGVDGINYTIRWFRSGLEPLEIKGYDETGVLFIDELPK